MDELYGLDPSEFTARRDAIAAESRKAGDRELAAVVKGLRRPSAAAYTVNIMARSRRDEIGRLIELGARLREAQAALSGDELRALGRQRQQVVAGLGHEARQLAREAGHPISEATSREVEATFEAALADAAAGEAVRAGRLIRALEHRGMDPVDLTGAVAGVSTASRDETPATSRSGPGHASPGGKGASPIRDGGAKRAEPESAAGTDAGGPDHGEEEQRRREERERREAEEARARAEGEAAAARAEQAAERAEEAARQADRRRAEAVAEHEAAEQRRVDADDTVRRLEEELAQARERADGAAKAEHAARRARHEAEEEADTGAAAARRARASAEALRREADALGP